MTTFLLMTGIIMLVLGLVSYASRRRTHSDDQASALSLLPGDFKYESPDGNFRFYFPITTSIIISLILTVVLYSLR